MRSDTTDKLINKLKKAKYPYFLDILGIRIIVFKNVYPPADDSKLLAKTLVKILRGGEEILDFGTGTGFFSILAVLKKNIKSLAIDINPHAVECTLMNVKKYNLQNKIEVRLSDGFKNIKNSEKFDVIVASLPFESAKPNNLLERSVYDYKFDLRKHFFSNANNYLKKDGYILLSYSDYAEKQSDLFDFAKDYSYEIVAEKLNKDNELEFIYLARPTN